MSQPIVTPELARALNFIGMMAMVGVLIGAMIIQFYYRELPCTLCLLQRLAMVGVAVGAAMNLMLGPDARNYGVCLVSAVFGMAISLRQSLLHINPFFDKSTGLPTMESTANMPFGESILGLNMYVWGVVIFGTVMLSIAIAQMFHGQFEQRKKEPKWLSQLASIGVGSLFVVVALQTVLTFLECGPGGCPNNGGWDWWILR
jgi:disulfide bond formation protein DsbB